MHRLCFERLSAVLILCAVGLTVGEARAIPPGFDRLSNSDVPSLADMNVAPIEGPDVMRTAAAESSAVVKDLSGSGHLGGRSSSVVGGDTCATATVIGGLPYADTGNTCSFNDDYDEICPNNDPTSPDVVYVYSPSVDEVVDISLCGNSAYDTKLTVYKDVCGAVSVGHGVCVQR